MAQIAILRRELVDRDGWVDSARFNRTLAVYQVLPGPEAQELTIYFGTLAGGRLGGFVAGLAFVIPGFVLMTALAWLYVEVGIGVPLLSSAFAGCQAAVLALIVRGLHRIGSRAVTNRYLLGTAGVAFAAGVAGVPFLVSLFAAGAGYAFLNRGRRLPGAALLLLVVALSIGSALVERTDTVPPPPGATQAHADPARLFTTGLRAGALTFGGAYTAIPFVQDDATGPGGWMTTGQFLDGIALSGVIPAPLIIFATFDGYLGGGLVGAVAITIGIFLPAFAITLVGHRQLDALVGNERIHAVLDWVTAGVVGLVAATLVQLAPAAIVGVATLVIFAASLSALYLWQASAAIAFVIVAAGAAGVLIGA